MLGSIVIGSLVAQNNPSDIPVAVVAETEDVLRGVDGVAVTVADTAGEARELVRAERSTP